MALRLSRPFFDGAKTAVGWGLQRRAASHLLGSRKGQQLPLQPRRARILQSVFAGPVRGPSASFRDRVTHLKRLHVKDFILIEDELISLAPGLNCITGASGSGKTVLARIVGKLQLLARRDTLNYRPSHCLNAIGQLCGESVLDDVFRQNATNAVIEGVWQLSGYHAAEVQKILLQAPSTIQKPLAAAPTGAAAAAIDSALEASVVVDGDSELIITREFSRSSPSQDGRGTRSVCKINGVQVKAKTLKAIGAPLPAGPKRTAHCRSSNSSCLVDLNGQGAAYALQDSSAQLVRADLVDERAGTFAEADRFAELLREVRAAERQVTDMATPPDEEEAAELQALLDAVNASGVFPEEDEELRARLKQIEAQRADAEAAARVGGALGGGTGGAGAAVGLATRELRTLLARNQAAERAAEDARAAAPADADKAASEGADGDDNAESRAEQRRLLEEALEILQQCQEDLNATEEIVGDFARTLKVGPGAREAAVTRLREIEKLAKRHGMRTATELCDAADEAEQRLSSSDASGQTRDVLLQKVAQGRADLAAQGLTLSAKRRTAAKALEREVEAALSSLCMDGTRFRVGFEWEEAEAGGGVPVPDSVGEDPDSEYEAASAGFDRVSFLMSQGARDPFRPLAQIASGGERGRIMLALKIAPALTAASASDAASASRAGPSPAATAAAAAAAAKSPSGAAGDPAVAMRISLMMAEALKEDLKDVNGISDDSAKAGGDGSSGAAADLAEPAAKSLSLAPGPPVSIFDEIDAGVSGTVGTAVGAALLRLARTGQQVLCITHLPQVAAFADSHLRVVKVTTADGSRATRIAPLETDVDRANELSAMMDLGIAAGAEMLRAAELRAQHSTPTMTEAMAAAAARQRVQNISTTPDASAR